MADERSLFERLDSIEATSESTNKMVAEILGLLHTKKDDEVTKPESKEDKREAFQRFLKLSTKSWRWFGSLSDFRKWKVLAILSLFILMAVGLATTIISSICFELYSTFTLFENIWMIISVAYMVYAFKTQLTYEVNSLATHSPYKYETDTLGMKFPRKEKLVFRIFRWIAIVSVLCNIIAIWGGMGKTNQVLATIMEVVFLGAIIFAYFMNVNLYAQYSIIWVEGKNFTTKKKVVLALPPAAKQFMSEEEFRKMFPFFYE